MYRCEYGNFEVEVNILKDQVYVCFSNKQTLVSYHAILNNNRICEQICLDFNTEHVYQLLVSCFEGKPGFGFLDFNFLYTEPICLDAEFKFLHQKFRIQLEKDGIREGILSFFIDHTPENVRSFDISFTCHMKDVLSEVHVNLLLKDETIKNCHFLVAADEKEFQNAPVQFKKNCPSNEEFEEALFYQVLQFVKWKIKTNVMVGKIL